MNRTPLILAIVLLLLSVLYVGSYLALVKPEGVKYLVDLDGFNVTAYSGERYRIGGERTAWFFWPLEQIDRKVRPGAWGELEIERARNWDLISPAN